MGQSVLNVRRTLTSSTLPATSVSHAHLSTPSVSSATPHTAFSAVRDMLLTTQVPVSDVPQTVALAQTLLTALVASQDSSSQEFSAFHVTLPVSLAAEVLLLVTAVLKDFSSQDHLVKLVILVVSVAVVHPQLVSLAQLVSSSVEFHPVLPAVANAWPVSTQLSALPAKSVLSSILLKAHVLLVPK